MRLLGGALREIFGAKSIELAGATLGELLEAFVDRGGERIAQRVYVRAASQPEFRADSERLAEGVASGPLLDRDLRLLVNGRNALFLEGLDTPLGERDVVTVHFAGSRAFPGG